MKSALKQENDKFSAMTLKPVSCPIGHGNHYKAPKLWVIALENGPKHENDKFLAMTIKPASGPIGHVNSPSTTKLWAIAH